MGAPTGIDTSRPHSARVWNYWLGGKDWYPVDQAVGQRVAELVPGIIDSARADREFLRRAVQTLCMEHGIRQFLDIGTGLPTMDNTHQVAQRAAPESRVVYVDNDPLVLAHARALLTSAPSGATDYLDADVRNPQQILDAAAATLDFDQPVALMLLAIMHLIVDDEQAYQLVRQLLAPLPAGSFLVLTHACIDVAPAQHAVRAWNDSGAPTPIKARTLAGITRFFDGPTLLEPGVVSANHWRPRPSRRDAGEEVMTYAGVAAKS